MKLRGIHYMGIAVLVGLVAVFAVHQFIVIKTAAGVEPLNKVVIADADIPSGALLTERTVKEVNWPQNLVPSQAATSYDKVNGRVLMFPVSKGEPILMSKLAAVGTAAGLGGMLDENVRAFTVRVDDVSGVAGFIHPGDHVDVLMSLPVPNNRDEQISKVILQDIKVLTAGTIWERGRDNNPVSVNAVTLAVSPDQSEILNLASTQGKIRLVLRSQANKSVKATSGVLTSNLVNSVGRASQALSKESPKAESKPKGKVIEVIKGMKRYASETG